MKQLLLLCLCMGSLTLHAQCSKSRSSSHSSSSNHSSGVSTGSMRGQDYYGNSALTGFIIGAGVTNGLFSSGIGKTLDSGREPLQYTGQQWNQNKTGGFVEVMYELNTKRKIAFGFSGNWGALWKQKSSYHENAPIQPHTQPGSFGVDVEVPQQKLYALDWSMNQKVKLSSFMLFSDVELTHLSENVYLFIRPEIGFSKYSNRTTINAKDSCNCERLMSRTYDNKVSFTSGLGLGVNWNMEIIELKAMLGYRVYNPIGFSSREYVDSWEGKFDGSAYNFKGRPYGNLFSTDKPGTPQMVGRRDGTLYFQLGLYFNFGAFNDMKQ